MHTPPGKATARHASAIGRFVLDRTITGLGTRAARMLLLDALINLFTVNGNLFRSRDADAHLVALDAQDRNRYLVADHQGFPHAASQNQHDRNSVYSGSFDPKLTCAFPSGLRCIALQGDRDPARASRDYSGFSVTRTRTGAGNRCN